MMSNLYRFQIKSRNPKWSHDSMTTVQAHSILEAKNKFKSMNPEHKIISCVKMGEVFDPRKASSTDKKSDKEESSSLVGALIGAAITAGIGLFLKNK